MAWSQTLVIGWLQFAIGAMAILLIARGALCHIRQPVERIRLILLALAAATAIPLLLAVAPWRIGLYSIAATAATSPAAEKYPAITSAVVVPEAAVAGALTAERTVESPTRLDSNDADRPFAVIPPSDGPLRPEVEVASAPATSGTPFNIWTAGAIGLFAIHALAVIVLAVEAGIGSWQLRGLIRTATSADQAVTSAWRTVTDNRGYHVRLLVSDAVDIPLAFGWRRRTVIVPGELAAASESALRSCLAHEWSHIERGDLVTWQCAWACQFLLWPQPLYWALCRELRICQDMLADAGSIRAGHDSISYCELLVGYAKKRGDRSLRVALTFLDRPGHLRRRVAMLLETAVPPRSDCTWKFSLGSLLAAALATLAIGVVRFDAIRADDSGPTTGASVAQAEPGRDKAQRGDIEKEAAQATTGPSAAELARRAPQDVAADEIAGLIVDEQGQPLADVTVDAWHWYRGNETKTDETGLFRLKKLDAKRGVEILITKPDYTPQHFPIRPTGAKGWVIVLGQKTYLEGTVVDADGKPVSNAEIRASFGPVQADGVMISEVTTQGQSRDDGTYRLHVPPGVYDLQVSAKERGVFRQSSITVQKDEARALAIRLEPGVHFEARVVDSITGEPVEGFVLFQWRPPNLVARSDAQGKIAFDGLIPGTIAFNCGGGEARQNAGMKFFQHGPFGRWWSKDANNEWQRFHIDDSQSGWQRNFDDLSFELRVGMRPVEIVVEQGVTVTGRVTDPRGNPVARATVAPARTGSGNSLTGDTRYSVSTNKEGNYRVVLPASQKATYNLIVHDGKYGEWRNWANGLSEPMKTIPGQKIEGLDLQLTEPATVKGRVLLGGKPVAGREVRAHSFDKRENRYYDPTTKTRDDGTFELKFIRAGKHYVQVEPFWLSAEQAPQGSTIVELADGQVLENIELQAAPEQKEVAAEVAALPYTARVLDAHKRPVANVPVALGTLGGVRMYFGAMAKHMEAQWAAMPEPHTDEQGLVPLDVRLLAQMRQSSTLVYAVDSDSRRAGIALLNFSDFANATADDPPVVDVVLEPAVSVRIEIGAAAFKDLEARPKDIYLSLMHDALLLQRSTFAEPGAVEIMLPSGAYHATVFAFGLTEMSQTTFQLDVGKNHLHSLRIELEPSRLARLIGQPAPEFASIKPAGDRPPLRLEDLRGKVVVLDFWGHWCGPCVAGMPGLVDLYGEFRDRGVEVVAVHDDSLPSVKELEPILARLTAEHWNGRKLPFPVLLDGGGETPIPGTETNARGATTAAYGVTSFPTTLLIDRTGRVAGQIHPHDLQGTRQRLEKLLRQAPP